MSDFYIGCDLGGTNLRAGIVNTTTGAVSNLTSIPTLARQGHEEVIERMAGLFETIIHESGLPRQQIGGAGVGVPGSMDIDKGEVKFLPNLQGHWRNVPLAAALTERTGLPAAILNDVRSITFGEWKFGAGRGAETMVCFAIGTGVGGGLIINNRLHLGLGANAGELGHQTVEINGPLCGCGNRGCLEVYSSGPAIAAMGLRAIVQGMTTRIGELVDYDLKRVTPEIVFQAAQQGDAVALDIFNTAGTYLGIAVGNILCTVSPSKVVIAGGISRAGELLLEPIRRTVRQHVKLFSVDQVEILTGELGDDAGVIGAALWAKERIH